MRYTVYSLFFLFISFNSYTQYSVECIIKVEESNNDKTFIKIYSKVKGYITEVEQGVKFTLKSINPKSTFIFISNDYSSIEKEIDFTDESKINIYIPRRLEKLNEIILNAKKKDVFALKRMKDFEKTAIYAGKKTEVILVEQSMANLASNNARQIFNQISGLNIYQNDDAGLQLHIGGRGLDPNRTSNFNTRQNSYDISADVLGYPESYYTPPAEALEEIQVIRGAASLQYGTQFGGLLNFKLKETTTYRPISLLTRNTIGSNGLYTNFTQLNGRLGKLRYNSFFNLKKGNGFRPNSKFDSSNVFFNLSYDISDDTQMSSEITYLDYLAQQPGGLSDGLFRENPYQSNRERNWFGLYWFLYNFKIDHAFSENSNLSLNIFGLNAQRNSIGFRSNRVSQIDPNQERDLIKGDFNNYGAEIRWLRNYSIGNNKSVLLLGGKYYRARNTSAQGPGSELSDPDFSFYTQQYPTYNKQSNYIYPNKNIALFTENIFYISDDFSITPGIRYENILTSTVGNYQKINTDAAGNVILNQTFNSEEQRKRSFILLGVGLSYKASDSFEIYGNGSQNYRSVTFADISIINPAFAINPDITDEKGYTLDLGIRGKLKKLVSFDLNIFHISYQDRIGFIQKSFSDGSVKSERGNIGDARLNGIESLIDLNISEFFNFDTTKYSLKSFLNYSFIKSKYIRSATPGIVGKNVEFVPENNIKTGLQFGYKNLAFNLQYSYISNQYTDSSNAVGGNLSGVIGIIPSYKLLDFSGSYTLNKIKFEFGINNFLNEAYFTRRATGYPGPGIIPSPNRNIYLTTQIKL